MLNPGYTSQKPERQRNSLQRKAFRNTTDLGDQWDRSIQKLKRKHSLEKFQGSGHGKDTRTVIVSMVSVGQLEDLL